MCSSVHSGLRLYCASNNSCTVWVAGAVLYEWQQLQKWFASDAAYLNILCHDNTKEKLLVVTKIEILVFFDWVVFLFKYCLNYATKSLISFQNHWLVLVRKNVFSDNVISILVATGFLVSALFMSSICNFCIFYLYWGILYSPCCLFPLPLVICCVFCQVLSGEWTWHEWDDKGCIVAFSASVHCCLIHGFGWFGIWGKILLLFSWTIGEMELWFLKQWGLCCLLKAFFFFSPSKCESTVKTRSSGLIYAVLLSVLILCTLSF